MNKFSEALSPMRRHFTTHKYRFVTIDGKEIILHVREGVHPLDAGQELGYEVQSYVKVK